MKVRELQELLTQCDPEAVAVMTIDFYTGFEYPNADGIARVQAGYWNGGEFCEVNGPELSSGGLLTQPAVCLWPK